MKRKISEIQRTISNALIQTKMKTPLIDNEHAHQKAVFEWMEWQANGPIPELRWAFAVPNGQLRHIAVAKKLKAEGVKAGVPDIFIPVARNSYHGLFIEMKRPNGKTSDVQEQWLNNLSILGYFAYCCHSSNEAIDLISYYFGKAELPKKMEYQGYGNKRD